MRRRPDVRDGCDISEAKGSHDSKYEIDFSIKCRNLRRPNLERRHKPGDAVVETVTTMQEGRQSEWLPRAVD